MLFNKPLLKQPKLFIYHWLYLKNRRVDITKSSIKMVPLKENITVLIIM